MKRITCIIIEDKQTDMDYLQSLVARQDVLELKGCFYNPLEANTFVQDFFPQLVFMDIDMPVMSGIDFLKKLSSPPICVFVTAYSEHAWESYELQAFDFILKPAKADRFDTCIKRLTEYLELRSRSDIYESQVEKNTIIIKEGTTQHIIDLNDILYIEALKDYSKVVMADKKIMTLSKLKQLMERLPEEQFVRIHRSYAVSMKKINKIEGGEVFLPGKTIPIGKTYRKILNQFI